MKVSVPVKVFVSYSWSTEKETHIVDELGRLCPPRGITLIRDNDTLKHGDLIKKFMDELSKGDHVITIFSKPYFESKWCMYELLRIYQRGDFQERTHPVIADGCDLQNEDYRLQVVDYWREQFETTQDKLKKYDPLIVQDEHKRVKRYRDIYQNINELLNFAAGRVTTPLAELQQNNFAQLLDPIKLILPNQQSSSKSEAQKDKVALAITQDREFLQKVQDSLSNLKQSSPIYYNTLTKQCAVPSKEVDDLPGYLVRQCMAGHFSDVVRNMQSALATCLKGTDATQINTLESIFKASENLISKLVLFNIKFEWMEEYHVQFASETLPNYTLPDLNPEGLEVVISRVTQTIPGFKATRGVRNISIDKVFTLEIGIKHGVDALIKSLHSKIVVNKINEHIDSVKLTDQHRKQLIDEISDAIEYRKGFNDIDLKKQYFLQIPSDENSPMSNKELQEELTRLIPELEWITVKAGMQDQVFLVKDVRLKTAIREFFTTLEEYKPQ